MDITSHLHYFRKENYIAELQADNKYDLLEEMIAPLFNQRVITNKKVILETLKKRELLGSTGIGKGVAIPHCRSLAVSDIHIVVGISKEGIPYEASDNEKVRLFFLIIAPPQEKSNLYLPFLGKIVELVWDTEIRESLKDCSDFSSFLTIIKGAK